MCANSGPVPFPVKASRQCLASEGEGGNKLLLIRLLDRELVQRFSKVSDQCVAIGVADTHPGMSRLHVLAGVGAPAAGCGAELLGQMLLERRDVGLGKVVV